MTTYERGKEPQGAPVTWKLQGRMFLVDAKDHSVALNLGEDAHSEDEIDDICRAFHVAKLAEEAASMLGRAPLTPPGTTDWLRRYREATR